MHLREEFGEHVDRTGPRSGIDYDGSSCSDKISVIDSCCWRKVPAGLLVQNKL